LRHAKQSAKALLDVNIMNTVKTSSELKLAQIAWVVKDIKAAEKFFKQTLGISNFSSTFPSRSKDYKGTYYGKPSDAETLVSMGYSGDTFIELIQPVSGQSIFQDFLDKNPAGGMQHVAYRLPVAELDKVVASFTEQGYTVAETYDTAIAMIVMLDTTKDIGVMTELMGITKEGEKQVESMKKSMS
jgi:methylmalonyl-CoA/ethylmalonyl-CoA epimerase